jgi:hypothetical protein
MSGRQGVRKAGLWLLIAAAVVVAIPGAFIARFLIEVDDPAGYLPTLDALPVPAPWELEHTQAVRSFDAPPYAARWYLVDADATDVAPVAEDMLRSAGFELYTRVASSDWCDTRPIGATPAVTCPRKEIATCSENGRGGPVSCSVIGFRWLSNDPPLLERVSVGVEARNERADIGVGDEHTLTPTANRALVVVSVDHVSPRAFWASPTQPGSEAP